MLYFEIVFFLIIASFAYSALSIAPFVPTSNEDVQRVNALAKLKPGMQFVEFGCGNGKVSLYIAKHNPKSKVIGIELCFPLYVIAKLRQVLSVYSNLTIKYGNAFAYDTQHTDVLYIYGLPQSLGSVGKKLHSEMKHGARIISYVCALPKWEGKITKNKPKEDLLALYVYEK